MVFISDTDILGGTDSPKKQKKKKETTLVVKCRSMIILEVNIRKKVSCVFRIFLNVFHSRPVPDYKMFVFLVPKVHCNQSKAFNFQNFLGKHALGGPKNSQREFFGAKFVRPITYTIPPPLGISLHPLRQGVCQPNIYGDI